MICVSCQVTFSQLMSLVFSTICGVVCSDGIITGTEKIVVNKMMLSGTDKRTYSITKEVGCVSIHCKKHEQYFRKEFSLISHYVLDILKFQCTGCQWTCA